MPIELSAFPPDLITANPTSGDPIADGYKAINALKGVVKNSLPNITGPITATQDQLNNPILTASAAAMTIPYFNTGSTALNAPVTTFGLSLLGLADANAFATVAGVSNYVAKAGDTMTGGLSTPSVTVTGTAVSLSAGGITLGSGCAISFDPALQVVNFLIGSTVVATLKADGFRAIGDVRAGGLT